VGVAPGCRPHGQLGPRTNLAAANIRFRVSEGSEPGRALLLGKLRVRWSLLAHWLAGSACSTRAGEALMSLQERLDVALREKQTLTLLLNQQDHRAQRWLQVRNSCNVQYTSPLPRISRRSV
jgi:hypothetical protein